MHFRTFRLQPPHAPPSSGVAPCSGRAWPPIRVVALSAVPRTSHIPSSLVSRIRPNRVCVAGGNRPSVLRTILSFPVALHTASPRCSYFQLVAGSTATEGLPPSYARPFSSALGQASGPLVNRASCPVLAPEAGCPSDRNASKEQAVAPPHQNLPDTFNCQSCVRPT